jgi:uncharacterized phiE125 gp8 family phage protein
MYTNTTKIKSGEVITLEEAKRRLRIEPEFIDEDVDIVSIIVEATEEAEGYLDEDILDTTVVHAVTDFSSNCVKVQESPLQSITSIKYLDDNGDEQTVDAANYTLKHGQQLFVIEFDSSIVTDLLTVTFKTGYASASVCPAFIKKAIKHKVVDLYDVERGSQVSKAFVNQKAFERTLDRQQRRTF